MTGEHIHRPGQVERPRTKKEAQKTSNEPSLVVPGIDTGAILENHEEGEGAEALTARESAEGVGEHRHATGKKIRQFKKKLTDEEAAILKDKLLKKPPTRAQMIQEIRTEIHNEIRDLEKDTHRFKKLERFADLVAAVARIRELKLILGELLHATAEKVRNIWLKVVHGIV